MGASILCRHVSSQDARCANDSALEVSFSDAGLDQKQPQHTTTFFFFLSAVS
jgi:hypothetical protein